MKNSFKKHATLILFSPLFFLIFTSCVKDFIGESKKRVKDKIELGEILQEFADTEESKDGEAHAKLYLSSASTLNFVQKNNGNPFIANLTRDQWIGFYTSWDYDYFPIYNEVEFNVREGMALDSHLFQGFRDEEPDLFGNDIFVYVKTPERWKIVSISSTITAPDDTTDYGQIAPISPTPDSVFSTFVESFNTRNSETFASMFINANAPCFRFKRVFKETYSNNLHTAAAFFARLQQVNPGLEIGIEHLDIEVKDQFTATAAANYWMRRDGEKVEEGQLLASLAGTPTEGWKITSSLFSISKSNIDL